MKTRFLAVALAATTCIAIAASAYAYRNRSIAMNAWAEYEKAKAISASALDDAHASLGKERKSIAAARAKVEKANRHFYETSIRADAGLPLRGSLDPALADAAVRDWIHRTVIVGKAKPYGPAPDLYAGVGTKEGALLCGGMAITHAWAMQQLGIPARDVTLGGQKFIDGTNRKQTHAVSEVFYNGKWHISDPTFNISVDCSDGQKHLSVKEAFACLAREEDLVGVHGKTTNTGRTLNEFRSDYSTYFVGYELNATEGFEAESYPTQTWIAEALLKYGVSR